MSRHGQPSGTRGDAVDGTTAGRRSWWAGNTGRALVLAAVTACVLLVLGGAAGYSAAGGLPPPDSVALQFAGSEKGARELICPPEGAATNACRTVAEHRASLSAELVLLGGVPLGTLGLCLLGWRLFRNRRARRLARIAAVAAVVGLVLDLTENLLLAGGLRGLEGGGWGWTWAWAATAATLKVGLLLPALIMAVSALLVLPARALSAATDFTWLGTDSRTVIPPAPVICSDGRVWPDNAGPAPTPEDLDRLPAGVGICTSGGGIRSASVTLGALQALREGGVLSSARYLVSVSGGGYTAGALQLATEPHPDGAVETATDPAHVFEPGSPEEDHVRRHGNYVADGTREWLVALATLLRGALASLGLLAGLVTIVGILLGRFYDLVPIFDWEGGYPFDGAPAHTWPRFPDIHPGVVRALLVTVIAGIALWFASVVVRSQDDGPGEGESSGKSRTGLSHEMVRRGLLKVSVAATGLAIVVALLGVVVPVLVWGGVRALWLPAGATQVRAQAAALGGAAGTVVVAYAGAVVSMLARHKERIGGLGKWLRASGPIQRRVPRSLLQRFVVWLVLAALAALYALLLGAVVIASMRASTFDIYAGRNPDGWRLWPQWYVVVVPAAFVAVALWVDQTWMSLHPFYRRRLASAFAVRRVLLGGSWAARPYDFDERTPLSQYGEKRDDFPQVIFAAAAQLSGSDRTPPGRRAVSFTFSHDYIGGPQVGYVRTCALEAKAGAHIRADLTVESAVAVSGAAFASAMGRHSRAAQTLFALSNARLGTWLPNPAWLHERPPRKDWLQPRLPRLRRITYLLREILGVCDQQDRLLLVTDGGHYDNLGLVELLRHRCRVVYCIDSTGDVPPLAGTLSEAITLAQEELGVRIQLHEPYRLVPGGGKPLAPESPLAALNARLSQRAVVTGWITYPEPFKVKGEDYRSATGLLVVAKTALAHGMPYELLSYAAAQRVFPYDSTGDQWFNHAQFNAYRALGQTIGRAAVSAAKKKLPRLHNVDLMTRTERRLSIPPDRQAASGIPSPTLPRHDAGSVG